MKNEQMNEKIDPQVIELYDKYCHGQIDRREFFSSCWRAFFRRSRPYHGASFIAALCRSSKPFPLLMSV